MTVTPTAVARRVWSEDEVRALGVSTDLVTAGAVLGIGRTTAHALARDGRFPVPVLRVGRRYRVPVAPILHLLALSSGSGGAGGAAAEEALHRVDASSRGDSQRT